MSKELIDLLSQYGPTAVLLIAAGTIVAALISAANAAVVAWFNARSARQLAIDAAHREYRREFCAPFLNLVRAVDLVAATITETLGHSMDSGIPMSEENARSIATFATEQFQSIASPGIRVAPPRDATLYRALRESAKAEDTLLKALRGLDEALATGQTQDRERRGPRHRVVDGYRIADGRRARAAEALCHLQRFGWDNVVHSDARAFGEVRDPDNQRIAVPSAARVTHIVPNRAGEVRSTIDWYDARFVNHRREQLLIHVAVMHDLFAGHHSANRRHDARVGLDDRCS